MIEPLLAEFGLWIALLFAVGLLTGLAAGLFGIGGGVVTVPVLYGVFRAMGAADGPSLKTAIGTSLAVIVVTSVRSLAAHNAAGHVDRDVLKAWGPWIALGAVLGGLTAQWAPAELLAAVFAGGAVFIGYKRLSPRAPTKPAGLDLHHPAIKGPAGLGAGLFSALMGLGGGAVGVMVMTLAGRTMHQAIGTSAGFGLAVAVPGVAGFMISGLGADGLPAGSIGYVNLMAFTAMALSAGLAAPVGARLAHRLDALLLSRVFGVYVIAAGAAVALDIFI